MGAKLRRRAPARGPWYSEVLAGIALSYPDCCYVENGVSLSVVAPCCAEAHGCDIEDRAHALPPGARFWHMSSDDFFERYPGSAPHLLFIDGSHVYEQATSDYENAARILAPGGTIALHDTWPGSEAETSPDRCGDVWRLEAELPGEKFTFKIFSGLAVVRPQA